MIFQFFYVRVYEEIGTFFELEYDFNGNVIDKKRYFEGKKIMGASDKILSMMGKYPENR
ncbi:MAG: hypothetical protein J6P57_06645 [Lachnospiraceae bacterium]|nr:hypothetical protein [Lachnospiraceae bacterium]